MATAAMARKPVAMIAMTTMVAAKNTVRTAAIAAAATHASADPIHATPLKADRPGVQDLRTSRSMADPSLPHLRGALIFRLAFTPRQPLLHGKSALGPIKGCQ
jgi:hypothetical protein